MAEYQRQVEHLSALAVRPGWRDYVWHHLKQLDSTPGFEGIKDEVVQKIKRLSAAKSAEGSR